MEKISEDQIYARLKSAINALQDSRARVNELENDRYQPVAVIGMACSLPGGIESPSDFWRSLYNQDELIGPVPQTRWSTDQYYDRVPQSPGKMVTTEGGFVKNIEMFDAAFFGISPREALSMDPQQRLILKCSWRALEYAGITAHSIKGTDTGVFVGVSNSDYAHTMMKHGESTDVDAYYASGNALNVIAGRLSYFLDIHGPCMAIDTACSSSFMALHNAIQSLRKQECRLAIASGVNVIISPEGNIALSQASMLSPDGRCYTFDKRANGYVRSEGCVTLLLKRYDHAVADKNTIHAIINGSATNHGGRSSGLTVPNAVAQANLIRSALRDARVDASDVDYIETHGTGTALGDPIEITALNEVFKGKKERGKPLYLGSVKTNIGHLESASGMAGLLKVILAIQHRTLPATRHVETINPMIDLDCIPSCVVVENTKWEWPVVAGASSFGFSGINVHVIVTSPQPESTENLNSSDIARPCHLVALSGKDENALQQQQQLLIKYLLENPSIALADIAYSYNACRDHFSHRLAYVCDTQSELLEKIDRYNRDKSENNVQTIKKNKIAFLISGQVTQIPGMGKQLYASSPAFRSDIDTYCSILNPRLGVSLQEIMFSDNDLRIHQTQYTQPIIFAFNYALARLWMSWGIIPDCYVGHSVGEYIAATLAGVMAIEDALKLICDRAMLMGGLEPGGGMLAVMAKAESIEPIIQAHSLMVDVAVITDEHTVLSGKKRDLEMAKSILPFTARMLPVSYAFHSFLMDPILDRFKIIAEKVTYQAPRVKVISNLTGKPYDKNTVNADYWVQHMRQAVDLRNCMASLHGENIQVTLEIGPRPAFSGLSYDQNDVRLYSMRSGGDDWQTLLDSLSSLYCLGFDIDWEVFDRDYSRVKCQIPGYPFQEQRFWGVKDYNPYLYRLDRITQPVNGLSDNVITGKTVLISNNMNIHHGFENICQQLVSHHVCTDDENSLMALLEPEQQATTIQHVVYVVDSSAEGLIAEVEQNTRRFLTVLKALLKNTNNIKLWLVTEGAVTVQTDMSLASAPLLGMRKCLLLESAEIDCIHIDFDSFHDYQSVCRKISMEMTVLSDEKEVSYQDNIRYVPRLNRLPLPLLMPTAKIDPNACYLITGGQGALASVLIDWFYKQRATHLVMVSRSQVSSHSNQLVEEYKRLGMHIEYVSVDVCDNDQLSELFNSFGNARPALKGIIHAAGVLDDGLVMNLDWPRFAAVYQAKVNGAWNLHELSLNHQLDYFIMFSSMSSMLGAPGQANYAAANAFQDALSTFRVSNGLPSLAINWGPWADVGMAKNIISRAKGLTKLTVDRGTQLFDYLMRSGVEGRIMAADINWEQAFSNHNIKVPLLENLVSTKSRLEEKPVRVVELDLEVLRAVSQSDAKSILIDRLQQVFKRILKMEKPPGSSQNFFELGMDSLMAIELSNNLQHLIGKSVALSQTILFDKTTIDELTEYLYECISGNPEPQENLDTLLSEDERLLSNIDDLSEDEIDALLEKTLSAEGF